MNTMKAFLAATFGLLLALLVLLFQGNNSGSSSELEQLRLENERLLQQEQLLRSAARPQYSQSATPQISIPAATPSTPPPSASTDEQMQKLKELEAKMAQFDTLEEENLRLQEEKDAAEKKAETYKDEAGLIAQRSVEANNINQRRARQITQALLMGQVESFNAEWNFVTFRTVQPDAISEGMELGIRRNTGLRGRIRVDGNENGEFIGSIVPGSFFGEVDVQAGDELIIPPPFLNEE